MVDWLADNWSPLLMVFMFSWLLARNRTLRVKIDRISKQLSLIEKLVTNETPVDEASQASSIPRFSARLP